MFHSRTILGSRAGAPAIESVSRPIGGARGAGGAGRTRGGLGDRVGLGSLLLALALLLVGTGAQADAESGAVSIDINRASAEQLAELPGIGAAKAAAIVDYRAESGPFQSVDDLENVRGIGPALVAKLRPFVKLASGGRAGAGAKGGAKPAQKARTGVSPALSPSPPRSVTKN